MHFDEDGIGVPGDGFPTDDGAGLLIARLNVTNARAVQPGKKGAKPPQQASGQAVEHRPHLQPPTPPAARSMGGGEQMLCPDNGYFIALIIFCSGATSCS